MNILSSTVPAEIKLVSLNSAVYLDSTTVEWQSTGRLQNYPQAVADEECIALAAERQSLKRMAKVQNQK
jgi:hypothetical protein